ncbi:MAG: BamA/TamA family outer membrane protein, partial [Bdellovibrionales bacterium]|nr:BamA/TamA family outer membrane protein [Bdellovibrionales bacterium]
MNRILFFILPLLFPLLSPAATGRVDICGKVHQEDELPLNLTENELRLVCGDKPSHGAGSEAWANIPPNQATFHLKAILQVRGYQNPFFRTEGEHLFFKPGPLTEIRKFSSQGAPESVNLDRQRRIVGQPLSPSKLNEAQDRVEADLKHQGYPCPRVQVVANAITGELRAQVEPDQPLRVQNLTVDPLTDLRREALTRYYAFHIGEPYDSWKTTITDRRILEEDLLVGSHFQVTCTPTGADLHHGIIQGLPRLIRVGFGADTEQGPLLRLSWRNSRLGVNGSSLENSLRTTLVSQEFTSDLRWYLWKQFLNFHLRPVFRVQRKKEIPFESVETTFSIYPSVRWDSQDHRFEMYAGPTWLSNKTVVGKGPANSENLLIDGAINFHRHDFEHFKQNPQSGYRVGIEASYTQKAILGDVTAFRLGLTAQYLWNYKNYNPPLWVLGLRTAVGTTITPNGKTDLVLLPQSFRHFLGGSQDMRGFSRKELPHDGLGSLTQAYLGAEARFFEVLPYQLHPLIFFDVARLGQHAFTVNEATYISPGFGVRWA